jgi:2,3-bisphosphoglycerate-independent phosphoglycerate mutase
VSYPRVCLVVLDGWGLAEPGPGNAISLADTPVFDELWERYPHTTLTTHGPAVGLPEGQMGNSEVGHLNLGAGAVVKQDLLRIDESIEDGSFFEDEALRAACKTERLHMLGLVSDGGVHSSMEHLRALIELAGREGVSDVVVHAFTDGREPGQRRAARGRGGELGRLPDRDGERPLLRHGPRQPLGPDPARLRRDRVR